MTLLQRNLIEKSYWNSFVAQTNKVTFHESYPNNRKQKFV